MVNLAAADVFFLHTRQRGCTAFPAGACKPAAGVTVHAGALQPSRALYFSV